MASDTGLRSPCTRAVRSCRLQAPRKHGQPRQRRSETLGPQTPCFDSVDWTLRRFAFVRFRVDLVCVGLGRTWSGSDHGARFAARFGLGLDGVPGGCTTRIGGTVGGIRATSGCHLGEGPCAHNFATSVASSVGRVWRVMRVVLRPLLPSAVSVCESVSALARSFRAGRVGWELDRRGFGGLSRLRPKSEPHACRGQSRTSHHHGPARALAGAKALGPRRHELGRCPG